MFRRTFWFTAERRRRCLGHRQGQPEAQAAHPESLAAQAADRAIETGHKLKDFALDVRESMARREAELGEALGLQAPVDPDLPVRRHYVVEASEPVGPEGPRDHRIPQAPLQVVQPE